jgi:D-alanyl-D-alanine carboxypeptidase/D-alanyl-D-alanine-endopeptidase (penicillin-binding protein 4)
LFVANPEQPLLPASTQKLFVAAAALSYREELGKPLEPFTTSARVLNQPVNGVVAGDLYIVGSGDPLLSTSTYGDNLGARDGRAVPYTDLNKLATSLKDAGITQITGNIVGDGYLYGAPLIPQGWESYVQQGAVGPISGLSVNDGYASGSNRIVVSDPPAVVAATLKSLLNDVGVAVGGRSSSGVAPLASTDVAVLAGAPIQEVVSQMLQYSDNNTAEALARHLGAASGATTPIAPTDAMNAVTQVLTQQGLDMSQVRLDDASGLTRTNLATCKSLAQVLTLIPDSALLAQNSQTGTLDERLGAFPGRLSAKTGTLNGVSSLAGFLQVANATEVSIVLVYNGSGAADSLKAAEDQAIAQLLNLEIGAP